MPKEKLKPCPFCGTKPVVRPMHPRIEGDAWTNIACPNIPECGQASVTVYAESGHFDEAARRWNRRTTKQANA